MYLLNIYLNIQDGEKQALMWLWVPRSQKEPSDWGVEDEGVQRTPEGVTLEPAHYRSKDKTANPSPT